MTSYGLPTRDSPTHGRENIHGAGAVKQGILGNEVSCDHTQPRKPFWSLWNLNPISHKPTNLDTPTTIYRYLFQVANTAAPLSAALFICSGSQCSLLIQIWMYLFLGKKKDYISTQKARALNIYSYLIM